MKKFYIRIGELPPDGKSKIYQWDNDKHTSRTPIGEEIGISAYNTFPKGNDWKIYPPNEITESFIDTFTVLVRDAALGKRPVYLVEGEEIGVGQDGEPLITDVKILDDISEAWTKL